MLKNTIFASSWKWSFPFFSLKLSAAAILLAGAAANVHATPGIMQHYGAPDCTTCHTSGAYSAAEGQAGLAAFLAATSSSSCTPPMVLQNNACVTPPSAANSSDQLFDYFETAYPEYFSPAGAPSSTIAGFYYRYYSATNSYIATTSDSVFYIGPISNNQIFSLGTISEWLNTAGINATASNTSSPTGNYPNNNGYYDDDEGYEGYEGNESNEHHGGYEHDDD